MMSEQIEKYAVLISKSHSFTAKNLVTGDVLTVLMHHMQNKKWIPPALPPTLSISCQQLPISLPN